MSTVVATVLTVGVGILIQLTMFAYFVGRITERVDGLEDRVKEAEEDIAAIKNELMQLSAIAASLDGLTQEFHRVRDRLDKFLDSRAVGK